jgi:hypothetical protein
VTTVERTNADGEDQVVGRFVGLQREVLGRDLADFHAARGDLVGRRGSGLGDGSGGSVDGQHVPGDESSCYSAGRRPRSAPDLEHAGIRLKGECVHDRREARRQTYWHGRRGWEFNVGEAMGEDDVRQTAPGSRVIASDAALRAPESTTASVGGGAREVAVVIGGLSIGGLPVLEADARNRRAIVRTGGLPRPE